MERTNQMSSSCTLNNIIVVTTEEPFYLPLTLKKIMDSPLKRSICRIIILPPQVGKQTWKDILSEQLRFGYVYFLYRGLQYVCYKLLAKFNVRFRDRFFSIRSVAEHNSITVTEIENINSLEAASIISSDQPELIISISASQIFGKKTLSLSRWGIINVHNSPLPRYQGLMPSFWVLCNGEKETATTVHYVDEGIDTGAIIIQKFIVISKDETLDSLIRRTKLSTADILQDTVKLFIDYKGNPPSIEKNSEKATYYSFPQKKDIKVFRQRGRKLLWKGIY